MNYEIRKYIGNTSTYTTLSYVSMPFGLDLKRSEDKDEGLITQVAISDKRRIAKRTRIEIVETTSNIAYQFVVVKDSVTKIKMSNPQQYNHDITLIKSSALLEDIQLPNIKFSRNTSNFINILTENDFINISNDLMANYTLLGDITISNISSLGDFSGTLNGNGHTVTIQNLQLDNTLNSFALFNSIGSSAIINNINFIFENSSFEIIHNARIIDLKKAPFGLLCANNYGTILQTKITNSNITIDVKNGIFSQADGVSICVGSFAGINNGKIDKCWIKNTYNRLNNNSTAQNGYIGNMVGINNGTISNSASYGGIITTTQATSAVYSSYKILQGGFAGYNNGIVLNSYCFAPSLNYQNVIQVVGFIPKLNSTGTITNCYFYVPYTPSTEYLVNDSLGTYKTQAEMKQKATYVGFDFNKLWTIDENIDTPQFIQFSNTAVINPLSIENILNRLLYISKPLFKGQSTQFELSTNLLENLSKLNYNETSEFFFNELNLWEALLEIGGKINAIPKLVDYKYIDYDFLNINISEWTPPTISWCGQTLYQDPEEYATNLISYGKNVVVSDDEAEGVIEFPYVNGFITPRCLSGSGVRITNATSVFWIGLQIYNIERVKIINCDNDNPNTVYDITKYIFEKNQYDALPSLSSPTSTYPNVQGRALIYNQYGEYIYGLTTQPIAGFTPPYTAFENILRDGLGISNPNTNFYTVGWNIKFRANFDNVTHSIKRNYEDFPFDADLLINQTVNQVSSRNWGNYQAYKMDKLGNISDKRRYIFTNITQLPQVGQKLIDEELFVNEMKIEFYKNIIVADIYFTKNFNKLSEYISVNSRKRPFQIALDNVEDRHDHYQEFIRFSNDKDIINQIGDYTQSHISDLLLKNIFLPAGVTKQGSLGQCNVARVQTYNADEKQISDNLLSVSSYAQPRSVAFTFAMQDNIRAGSYADTSTSLGSDGYINKGSLYAENGECEYAKINFLSGYIPYTDAGWSISAVATKLPITSGVAFDFDSNSLMNINDYRIIKKDNREVFSNTTQIQFINDEGDIIIGNDMSYNCLAVKDANSYPTPKLYVLNRRLEDYELAVPLDAIEVNMNSISQSDVIDKNGNLSGVDLNVVPEEENDCKSWFLADNGGQIIIGKQLPLYAENHIYAFKQLTRPNTSFESNLSAEFIVNTDINLLTDIDINITGINEEKGQYVDFGDGTVTQFKFDNYGQYRILHTYIPSGDMHIKIYANIVNSIYAYPQEYIFKNLYIYNNTMQEIDLYNNEDYANVQFTELDLTGQIEMTTLQVSNVSTLTSVILDNVNTMQVIDLSHTGMVNDENMLLSIVAKLPDRTGQLAGTFTCVGTHTPADYAYWESVLNALTLKHWDYIWTE